jgi:hypothetical protein
MGALIAGSAEQNEIKNDCVVGWKGGMIPALSLLKTTCMAHILQVCAHSH